MGLCKCPRKVVTTLFCYEHRVNVCEHCMVTYHPSCVIQSYYRWLQDTDYDPKCPLCGTDLSFRECVRLMCYHVFHWSCFKNRCDNLPNTTAPIGYACPQCSHAVFPAQYLISPVADELRKKLTTTEWGRMQVDCSSECDSSNPISTASRHNETPKAIKQTAFDKIMPVAKKSISRPSIDRYFSLNPVFKQHSGFQPKRSVLFSIDEERSAKYTRRRKFISFTQSFNYLRRSAYGKFTVFVLISFVIICFVFVLVLPDKFDSVDVRHPSMLYPEGMDEDIYPKV